MTCLTCVKKLLTRGPCIADLNIIGYMVLVAEPLLIIIWVVGFYHLGLTQPHGPSEILSAIFEEGKLWFISTWYDNFNLIKSYTTIKTSSYVWVSLSVILQSTTFFSMYQIYFIRNINSNWINFTIIMTYITSYISISNVIVFFVTLTMAADSKQPLYLLIFCHVFPYHPLWRWQQVDIWW